MEMIAAGVERARRESITLRDAADRMVEEAKSAKQRVPGLGHRVHSHDPRTDVLFRMARDGGVAKDGVAFMEFLEVAAREKNKTSSYQRRRRSRGSAPRSRLFATGWQTVVYRWTGRRTNRGSGGRIRAGEGDAHSHPG